MKILIVDDSLMDRKLLSVSLKKFGLDNEILQAKNGQEGLEVLKENVDDIGVILLDWQMPEVDGIEFMARMQNSVELAKIPVVMITASGSDEDKKVAYETNPHLAEFVVKPYKAENLVPKIRSILQG